MLLVVFRIAGEVYAVDAAHVVAVVPRIDLRVLPHAPESLAGLFRYRDQVVPVVDLGVLLGAGPCAPRLSTRIILVDDPMSKRGVASVGLIAEHVSDVRRVADDRVIPSPALLGQNPYLGPIVSSEGEEGLIPLLAVEQILTGSLRRVLAEVLP
jgi:chemotaxis-related protein WspB